MSIQDKMGESEFATPHGWGAQPPVRGSIAEPVLSGDYGETPLPEAPRPPSGGSRVAWFAAVSGALVLLLGGGFFALTAFAATGGAATPEEAVDALIEAANDEDFIALAELLEPAERRTLAEPMITEVLPELIRLGVLDDSVDAGNVEGFEWEFTDVSYRVEPIADSPDMVHVYFTGGQAAAEFTAAEFPFGAEFRERFRDELQDEPRTTDEIEDTGTPMVLVERDGRWYMSMMFTIAENARLESGERLPGVNESPQRLGSASPEGAIEAMFGEMVELDLAGMVGRMDPDELAVVYRYAPLFLEEGQRSLDELQSQLDEANVRWDMTDFDFDVDTDGDDATVIVRGFRIEVQADDLDVSFTYGRDRIAGTIDAGERGRGSLEATPTRWTIEGVVDGESVNIVVDIDADEKSIRGSGDVVGTTFTGELDIDENGVCSRYSIEASDDTQESGCIEDGGGFPVQQYIGFFDSFGPEFGGVRLAARRTDGQWYVSPITTTLDYYIRSLQGLDEGQFEQMLDSLEAVSETGFMTLDTLDTTNFTIDPELRGTTGPDAEFDEAMADFERSQQEFDEFLAEMQADAEGFGDGLSGQEEFPGFPEAVASPANDIAVPPGGSISIEDRIDSGSYDVVLLDLRAGEVLTVTVEADPSSDLDTTVEVFGPEGSIGYNDDALSEVGLGFFDSQLIAEITMDGSYRIEVRSFTDTGEGPYTLTVTRS